MDLILVVLLSSAAAVRAQCSDGAVEFVGLPVTHAGIVRVCVDGVWGTICAEQTTPWSEKNSQVACRRLGYAGAINPILQSTLVSVSTSIPIHYRSVECDGTETELSQCSHSENTAACSHEFDAAVTCKPYFDDDAPNGDVRLLGDSEDGRGAVEYYYQGVGWTGVCVDPFHSSSWLANTAAANIVCRQLGYEGGSTYQQDGISTSALQRRVGGPLICDSGEVNLDQCSSSTVLCVSSVQMAGGVVCSRTAAADYSVRLVGGDRSGVVEVAFNGRWGTVCEDSDWRVVDATVICNQLGFTADVDAVVIYNNYPGFHSRSAKPVWLGGVVCTDTDTALSDCSNDPPIGFTSCSDPASPSGEVSCAATDSKSGGPSGGAIAGIVIGSLVGVGILCTLIHTWGQSEKKKKAARAAAAQCQAAPIPVPSVQRPPSTPAQPPQQLPPPADGGSTVTSFGPVSSPTAQSYSSAQPQAPPELVATAPPSYQAAVSYPAATTITYHQPPYPEKAGAYPEAYPTTSAAYPPPLPLSAPSYGGGPAYPPPPQDAYPPPGFNPAYLPPPAH